MDSPKVSRRARTGWIVLGAVILGLALVVGYLLGGLGSRTGAEVQSASVSAGAPAIAPAADGAKGGYGYSGADSAQRDALSAEGQPSALTASEPMVVRTASLELRVDEVEQALKAVRATAVRYKAQITDLYVYGGADEPVRPLGSSGAETAMPSPASASVTLRVAASDLDAFVTDLAKVGKVVTQTGSANDVTEQYIDLAARMKNLKVEEARLRSFFKQADKVSELLAVETELSRVRGEIEALQAQIDYLERQVAMATLTVTMSESGPVVRPESGDWGLLDAITIGIQAAVAVVRTMITGLIALTPLLVLGAIVVLIVGAVRRRKGRATVSESQTIGAQADDDEPPTAGEE